MDNNIIDITPCNVLPMSAVFKTANGQEINNIRRDEVQRIMSVLEGRDRLMVEALWNTGGRISEVLELTSQAVNFDDGTITIRTLKKKKRARYQILISTLADFRDTLKLRRLPGHPKIISFYFICYMTWF